MTPPSPTSASDAEQELARRLQAVGDQARVDADAWDDFLARAAASHRHRHRHRLTRPHPRVLAAAAAVTVLLGAAVLVTHQHRADTARTTDESTTTTTEPPSSTTTTTATTAPPTAPEGVPSGAGGPGPSGGAVAPGGGAPAGAAPADPADPAADPGTGAGPPPTTVPVYTGPRATPDATTWTAMGQYHVEVVYSGGTMYFRPVETATLTGQPPDGYGYLDTATWGSVAGASCLTSAGGLYRVAYASPTDAYVNLHVYGLAGPGIASVVVVVGGAGGAEFPSAADMGRDVGGGRRAWILSTGIGPVLRIEGHDANGNVVVTTTVQPDGPLESDADWSRTNC